MSINDNKTINKYLRIENTFFYKRILLLFLDRLLRIKSLFFYHMSTNINKTKNTLHNHNNNYYNKST
jgi:hypothetical protein